MYSPIAYNAFWWVPLILDADKLKCSVKEFQVAVEAEGVPCYGVQWPEMYQEQVGFGTAQYPFKDPNARKIDYSKFDCKKAKWLEARTMNFFPHPVYSVENMQACVDAFKKVADEMMK